jgi:hypothetical protein
MNATINNNCYQLVETERDYRAPITPPSAFAVTAAALRLAVDYLRRQPGWLLVEHMDGKTCAYATFKTPENLLYGLSVTDTTVTREPMEHPWLVRVVPVIEPAESETADYIVADFETPTDGIFDNRDGSDVAEESAGV